MIVYIVKLVSTTKIFIWFLATQGKLFQRLQKTCFWFGAFQILNIHKMRYLRNESQKKNAKFSSVSSMPYTYSLKVIFCHTFSAPGFRGPLVKWKEMWGFIFIFIFLPIVLCWHSESFGFGGTYDFWFFRFGIPKLSSWWWAWEPPMYGPRCGQPCKPFGELVMKTTWRTLAWVHTHSTGQKDLAEFNNLTKT